MAEVIERTWPEEISLVAGENDGFVLTEDALKRAVSASWLSLLGTQGRLVRVSQGLYRIPGWPTTRLTEYRQAVLWAGRKAVIGGEAALDVWQLCDVNPRKIDLLADPGYRPRKAGGERYRVSRRRFEDNEVGDFHGVKVLSPLAAIKDAIAKGVQGKLIVQAIETAQAQEYLTKREAARLFVALDQREGV
jgi:predicted transcriptional regulator of viral defense system